MTEPRPPAPVRVGHAAHTLSDAMTAFGRDDTGRIKLRRRSFGESVRWLLDLPPDTDDGDVLAELAVRKHETAGPRVAPEPREEAARRLRAAADVLLKHKWLSFAASVQDVLDDVVLCRSEAVADEFSRALLAGRPEQDGEPA